MNRSILIAGADHPEIFRRARELGLRIVFVGGDHASSAPTEADAAVVAETTSADELARVAREHRVEGIYAGNDAAVLACAEAARRLSLPGPAPVAVRLTQNSADLRAELARHACRCPRSGIAANIDEARALALSIGLPVKVGPAGPGVARRTWRVDYIEDLSLAVARAVKGLDTPETLLESVTPGPRYYVDCVTANGSVVVAGLIERIVSDPPFDFDTALSAPPELDAAQYDALTQTACRAVESLAVGAACVRVDLAATPEGPCVFGVRMVRPSGPIPADLILPVYGVDLLAVSLRLAVGESSAIAPAPVAAWALRWLASRSGVVTGVTGLDAARDVPGVRAVEALVVPGDVVGHIVDETSRDRIGYALATGENARAALASVNEACNLCRIATEPTQSTTALRRTGAES